MYVCVYMCYVWTAPIETLVLINSLNMGRAPCCDSGMKRGAWAPEEDELLIQYISQHGHGSWRTLPKLAGLLRCGKSCRLRWTNYLRPDIKRGPFTPEEEASIIQLHSMLGNRWAAIASQLSGRTDNEIKNFWNTHLKKRVLSRGHNSQSPYSSSYFEIKSESPSTRHMVQWESVRVEAEARLSMESSLLNSLSTSKTNCDHFLQLWNSGVGESFRKSNGQEGRACQSSSSQTSSSTKFGSGSGLSVAMQQTEPNTTSTLTNNIYEQEFEGGDYIVDAEDMIGGTKSSSSYELDDSSEAALKLLLDFPIGNDLGFL